MTPLRATLDAAFAAAAAERNRRQEWVDSEHDGGRVPGWVLHERQAMLDAVNAERAKRGKAPVALLDVMRVEWSACGHVDYRAKFVLGCAELVERP